jgi:hypothetical protein
MLAVARLALVLAAVLLPACTMDKPAWVDQKTANDAEANYYVEQEYEGRLYVFGTSASHKEFQDTHELKFAKSFIGAGPKGMTVRVELDPKNPALFKRLHSEFESQQGLDLED